MSSHRETSCQQISSVADVPLGVLWGVIQKHKTESIIPRHTAVMEFTNTWPLGKFASASQHTRGQIDIHQYGRVIPRYDGIQ